MLRKVERLHLAGMTATRDPLFPGALLYEGHELIDGFPRCDVPNSHYVVRSAQLLQMVSTAPDGLRYGWDTCGGCGQYITVCPCMAGPKPIATIRRWLQLDQGTSAEPTRTVIDPELRARVKRAEQAPAPEQPLNLASLDQAAVGESSSVLRKLKKRLG